MDRRKFCKTGLSTAIALGIPGYLAVTEECLKAGAGEVIIGEGSHLPSFDWKYAVTLDGSTNLVTESARLSSLYQGKVTLACLETDSPAWIDIPSVTSLNNIAISSLVAHADKVISIPVAKTHSWAQLTMGFSMGLGEVREESIEILGEKLDNLHVDWKTARLKG